MVLRCQVLSHFCRSQCDHGLVVWLLHFGHLGGCFVRRTGGGFIGLLCGRLSGSGLLGASLRFVGHTPSFLRRFGQRGILWSTLREGRQTVGPFAKPLRRLGRLSRGRIGPLFRHQSILGSGCQLNGRPLLSRLGL